MGAADFYQRKIEKRPHRPALTKEQAAHELRQAVKLGRLEGKSADAVLSIEYVLTLVYAVVVALVTLTLYTQMQSQSPILTQFVLMAGVAVVTLNLAEGVLGIFSQMTLAAASSQELELNAVLYLSLTTVHDALLFAGIFALGLWSLAVNWAALRTRSLPKALAYLGLFTGIQATVAIFFPPLSLPALHIVWTTWLGIVLMGSRFRESYISTGDQLQPGAPSPGDMLQSQVCI